MCVKRCGKFPPHSKRCARAGKVGRGGKVKAVLGVKVWGNSQARRSSCPSPVTNPKQQRCRQSVGRGRQKSTSSSTKRWQLLVYRVRLSAGRTNNHKPKGINEPAGITRAATKGQNSVAGGNEFQEEFLFSFSNPGI